MAVRKPKIVVVKEDFGAAQVAEESVANVVKAANIMNAVDTMASDFMPDEKSVLHNDELGLVFTELTDAEAKSLMGKAGVEAIEDDERVYALQTDEPGLSADDGSIDADLLEEDLEASAEINEDLNEYEDAKPEDFELITPEVAAIEAQRVPEVDDFDIGDNGEIISFDDTTTAAGEAATGIPRDKLVALVKCIIKCALETTSGQVVEVSDEKISEILGAHGASGGSATVQAVRDYITCGLKIIYAPPAWRYSTGAGVRVAVVDTGIAPRHPDLRVYGGASFVPGVTRWHDDHGHGTHVAGTIAATANGRGVIGVAPAARLYAVKVLNSRGSGRISGILNGLAWCLRYRMHVVNLSLGSEVTTHDPRVYSRAYETAARRLRRAGILPVAAAGNSGRGRRPFVGNPGRCPSFMAVGAVDCSRRRAPFSSYGPQVEICAPGVGTWSTVPPNRYGQKSGTSMACPHVAGVAALVKRRRPAWSGDAIRVHMRRTALDLGTPGRDWFYGYGQVRAWHAVR